MKLFNRAEKIIKNTGITIGSEHLSATSLIFVAPKRRM